MGFHLKPCQDPTWHLENSVGDKTCSRLPYFLINIHGVNPGSVTPEVSSVQGKLALRKKKLQWQQSYSHEKPPGSGHGGKLGWKERVVSADWAEHTFPCRSYRNIETMARAPPSALESSCTNGWKDLNFYQLHGKSPPRHSPILSAPYHPHDNRILHNKMKDFCEAQARP